MAKHIENVQAWGSLDLQFVQLLPEKQCCFAIALAVKIFREIHHKRKHGNFLEAEALMELARSLSIAMHKQ